MEGKTYTAANLTFEKTETPTGLPDTIRCCMCSELMQEQGRDVYFCSIPLTDQPTPTFDLVACSEQCVEAFKQHLGADEYLQEGIKSSLVSIGKEDNYHEPTDVNFVRKFSWAALVKLAKKKKKEVIYMSSTTCWWTHALEDAFQNADKEIWTDPMGYPLVRKQLDMEFIKKIRRARKAGKFGEYGLDTFMSAHARNVVFHGSMQAAADWVFYDQLTKAAKRMQTDFTLM